MNRVNYHIERNHIIIVNYTTTQVLLITGGSNNNVNSLSITEVTLQTWINAQKMDQLCLFSQFTLFTCRWPNTLVAATWSGEWWRAATFQHQDGDWEPHWLTMSFMLLAVLAIITTSPQSWPGIHPRSPGNMLAILLWGEPSMQLLLSPFYNSLLEL